MHRNSSAGFTLIEISIVLIIIGLVVGGVLAGRDLIKAAEIRAQVTQIEQYRLATNTFKLKYGELPGDMTPANASALGFAARSGAAGLGDGNGNISGTQNDIEYPLALTVGESNLFWSDLQQSNLVASSSAINFAGPGDPVAINVQPAKVSGGNFVYVYSGGYSPTYDANSWVSNYINYFGIASRFSYVGGYVVSAESGISVIDAYSVDAKADDGLPQSGKIIAAYSSWYGPSGKYTPYFAAAGNSRGACAGYPCGPTTAATPASSTTCYDNGNAVGVQKYSLSQNNGQGINCALSFQF